MKIGRWITGVTGVVLIALASLHGMKIGDIEKRVMEQGIKPPLDGILESGWLIFSAEMMALAVIAFIAAGMKRGGWIVILCGAAMGINGALMFHFMGAFFAVYGCAAIGALYLVAGGFLLKQAE